MRWPGVCLESVLWQACFLLLAESGPFKKASVFDDPGQKRSHSEVTRLKVLL
jgi:hypothetical protein